MSQTPDGKGARRAQRWRRHVLRCATLCTLLACDEQLPAPQSQSEAGSSHADPAAHAGGSQQTDADAAPAGDAATQMLAAQPDAAASATPRDPDASLEPADAAMTSADAAPSTAQTRFSLVVPELWSPLDPALDPFDDAPPTPTCSWGTAVLPETLSDERVLGVDTGGCSYLSAVQLTQREVASGQVLKVRLWHFELNASDPAQAHAAVLVDGLPLLDERVPIPGPGGLIVKQLRVERAIAAGAPVYFHLHNHGANSWALVEVSAGP